MIQVNRRACRFGRYKSPRRPHLPLRASRLSCHPPQMGDLTFAHPLLAQSRSPSPAAVRSINRVTLRGSILAPGQRGSNRLPRRCRSWVTPRTTMSRLEIYPQVCSRPPTFSSSDQNLRDYSPSLDPRRFATFRVKLSSPVDTFLIFEKEADISMQLWMLPPSLWIQGLQGHPCQQSHTPLMWDGFQVDHTH